MAEVAGGGAQDLTTIKCSSSNENQPSVSCTRLRHARRTSTKSSAVRCGSRSAEAFADPPLSTRHQDSTSFRSNNRISHKASMILPVIAMI